MTIEQLQREREKAYMAWYNGKMKRRTARRLIVKLSAKINKAMEGEKHA